MKTSPYFFKSRYFSALPCPLLLTGVLLLSGCAQEFHPTLTPAPGIADKAQAKDASIPGSAAPAASRNTGEAGKLAQCTHELSALKTFNQAKWEQYQREFDRITRTSSAYLGVAASISGDINDLVRPRYQYALTSLCWHIRNDLSASLINQVGSHD